MRGKWMVALLAGAATVVPVQAQETAPVSRGLEDIVVTAQRKAENLQDVPVAVTAFSADNLDERRIVSARDLAGLAPGLQVNTQSAQSNTMLIIRGVSAGASNSGMDPKIGVYLDGVYIGRTVGSLFNLADIERIEVLRGPQGTLFGRNATGGAVSLTSGAPTGEWGFRGSVSAGNFGAVRAKGVLNLPSFGPLSLRFGYIHDRINGYAKNSVGGQTIDLGLRDTRYGVLTFADELGKARTNAVQVAANLDLDNLQVDYRFDWSDTRASPFPMQSMGVVGDSSGMLIGPIEQFQPIWGGITNSATGRLSEVANASNIEGARSQGHSLTMTLEANDNLMLKSITAFRKFRQSPTIYDLGATGGMRFTTAQLFGLLGGDIGTVLNPANYPGQNDYFFSLLTARDTKQRQFTQELQLQYADDNFDLTAGVFYFYENSPSTDILGIFEPVTNGVLVPNPIIDASFGGGITQQRAINKSLAGYGQLTWHATDTIDVTGGLRYTLDDRRSEIYAVSGAQGAVLGPGTYKADYNKLTFTGILTWRPNEDITTYAKVARGYVSGGIFTGQPFEPEILTTYELGFKSQFLDNRLRTNIALFYSKYNDLQTQSFTNGVQIFENAGKATNKGVELELMAVPVDGLTFSGMLSYTDFDYQQYITNGVDLASVANPVYFSSWLGQAALQYDAPGFANGSNLFARAELHYQSSMNIVFSPILDIAGNIDPVDRWRHVGPQATMDASIGLVNLPISNANASLTFFGRNLFDRRYVEFGATVIRLAAGYNRGRTYGVELGIRF